MKEIHSNVLYKKYYDRYSQIFIENFCAARKTGNSRRHAFAIARIKLQDLVIDEMTDNRIKTQALIKAYRSIVDDQQLYEKALICFRKYKEANSGK